MQLPMMLAFQNKGLRAGGADILTKMDIGMAILVKEIDYGLQKKKKIYLNHISTKILI